MFNLFKKKIVPSIPQTGVIFDGLIPSDAIRGINPRLSGSIILDSGDWSSYLPKNEKQSIPFTFDTLSCVTFSVLNGIEILFNLYIERKYVSPSKLKWLTDNGYFDDTGKINFSDRFIAIMSNTTKLGNTHRAVYDTVRSIGLIPEKDLPFGGTSFEEYHNKSLITDAMIQKARAFNRIVTEVVYEIIFVAQSRIFTTDMSNICSESLKQSPLAIAIKYPATHAITMYRNKSSYSMLLDHYDPFTYKYQHTNPIHFGYRIGLVFKPEIVDTGYPEYVFTSTIKEGAKGPDVVALQKVLVYDGFLDPKYVTGNFFSLTKAAVSQWQASKGLIGDGIVGAKSRAILNDLCLKKK